MSTLPEPEETPLYDMRQRIQAACHNNPDLSARVIAALIGGVFRYRACPEFYPAVMRGEDFDNVEVYDEGGFSDASLSSDEKRAAKAYWYLQWGDYGGAVWLALEAAPAYTWVWAANVIDGKEA